MAIHCPHCGSFVMIRGSRWECGYCGDFGSISSLHSSEKTKLLQMAAPSVQVTITMTEAADESDEKAPLHNFSPAELEDMVRRWDFSENEWARRDLLVSAFPEGGRFWTVEELAELDTMELLGKVGSWKPEVGIQMMRFLLDTAECHLQEPEAAEQLLENDLYELCRNQAVQPKLLAQLKVDEHLVRQLFQSAYAGDLQDELLEACDWLGESMLKEHLQSILSQNPYFNESGMTGNRSE